MKIFKVEIPWDVEEYYVRHVKGGRDKKRIKFPNPSFGKFSEPLTVVDSKGRIVLWYLPGLLSHEQLVSVSFLIYIVISYKRIKIVQYRECDCQHRASVAKVCAITIAKQIDSQLENAQCKFRSHQLARARSNRTRRSYVLQRLVRSRA